MKYTQFIVFAHTTYVNNNLDDFDLQFDAVGLKLENICNIYNILYNHLLIYMQEIEKYKNYKNILL